MVRAGFVRNAGIYEADAETLRRAHAIFPISALQIEYSLQGRGIEKEILPTARELGIAVAAYEFLSRGLLSGRWSEERSEKTRGYRSHLPRFDGENLQRNPLLVEALHGIDEEKRATVGKVAIAWVLAHGEDIIPLIGTRRPEQLHEALGAFDGAKKICFS